MDPLDAHPSIEARVLLDRGEISPSVVDEQEREHLHALCPECARLWEQARELRRRAEQDRAAAAAEQDRLRTRQMQVRLEGERNIAEWEVERLLGMGRAARAEAVKRAYRRYRTPAFVERMIAEAQIWIRHDCEEALALLAIAEGQLPRIRRDVYGDRLVSCVSLRVLAHRANTLRIAGDLRTAEAAFREVHDRLDREPLDDCALLGELASLEGSLRYDQRRLDEAEQLLERATLLYQRVGDGVSLAKVAIQRGLILFTAGEPAAALAHYEAAAAGMDPDAEPQLAFNASHNIVLCLCDVDQAQAAVASLDQCRALARRLGNATTSNQLLWAEGTVAAALGDDDLALARLRAARDAYAERGLEFDVALLCLDLAAVHFRRGETAEVKRLADRIAPAFTARGVDREAARAVALVVKAAHAEAVTVDLLATTRRTLLRAAHPAPRRSH